MVSSWNPCWVVSRGSAWVEAIGSCASPTISSHTSLSANSRNRSLAIPLSLDVAESGPRRGRLGHDGAPERRCPRRVVGEDRLEAVAVLVGERQLRAGAHVIVLRTQDFPLPERESSCALRGTIAWPARSRRRTRFNCGTREEDQANRWASYTECSLRIELGGVPRMAGSLAAERANTSSILGRRWRTTTTSATHRTMTAPIGSPGYGAPLSVSTPSQRCRVAAQGVDGGAERFSLTSAVRGQSRSSQPARASMGDLTQAGRVASDGVERHLRHQLERSLIRQQRCAAPAMRRYAPQSAAGVTSGGHAEWRARYSLMLPRRTRLTAPSCREPHNSTVDVLAHASSSRANPTVTRSWANSRAGSSQA